MGFARSLREWIIEIPIFKNNQPAAGAKRPPQKKFLKTF